MCKFVDHYTIGYPEIPICYEIILPKIMYLFIAEVLVDGRRRPIRTRGHGANQGTKQALSKTIFMQQASSREIHFFDIIYLPSTTMAPTIHYARHDPDQPLAARIRLDESPEYYTNLDNIHGCVILELSEYESISRISVKLEGEAQTTIAAAQHREGEKLEETHKVLYKTVNIRPGNANYNGSQSAAVAPGTHEYKFSFKIPFTNFCANSSGGSSGWGRFRQQRAPSHVHQTLPPSMRSVANDGEIRYFVKATIHRPGLMHENLRCKVPFLFLPMEAPRPPPTNHEVVSQEKLTLFDSSAMRAFIFDVQASLPSPAIVTCKESLPLRVLVRKTEFTPMQLYLTYMEIKLIGYTRMHTNGHHETRREIFDVMNSAGLKIPIGWSSDHIGKETEIDPALWDSTLPATILPSFLTCNIKRDYELRVIMEFYGEMGAEVAVVSYYLQLTPFSEYVLSTDWQFQSTSFSRVSLSFNPLVVYSGISRPLEMIKSSANQNLLAAAVHAAPSPRTDAATDNSLPPPYEARAAAPGSRSASDAVLPPSYDTAVTGSFAQSSGRVGNRSVLEHNLDQKI